MKVFVTGGAGFIGTALINRLNADVIVYDSLYHNQSCANMIRGDILDFNLLKRSIPSDTDIVINMAAVCGVDTVIRDPVRTMQVNTIGVSYLLEVVKELNIKRFINFSTSEVFGTNTFKQDENCCTNLPPVGEGRWTYSVSKLAAEHLVHSYHKKFGLKTVNIRPFNTYGPGQIGEGAIHNFVMKAIRNEPLMIHGEGDQIRSWCYIDDMVDATLLCLERKEAVGEVFNIGNPRGAITVLGLAEKIVRLAHSASKIIHVPKTHIDVDLRMPNIDKARNLLGFEPKVDLDDGIERTIEWYRKTENISQR